MTEIADNFVDFQNVWLAYNEELLAKEHFAVEDINLQVKQGEFIAIVGPSGCGKSTFMRRLTKVSSQHCTLSKNKLLIILLQLNEIVNRFLVERMSAH